MFGIVNKNHKVNKDDRLEVTEKGVDELAKYEGSETGAKHKVFLLIQSIDDPTISKIADESGMDYDLVKKSVSKLLAEGKIMKG